jgi:pyruvate,orthophosphate dikinase
MTLQYVEFTMQERRLWMLQCCTSKCICVGDVKITIDMVFEGLINRHVVIHKVEPQHLDQLLHPQVKCYA